MKNFLKENWFKLMTGTSMLVFSFAFLMYAVSPSYANYTKEEMPSKSDYALVPLNKDGSINIKISEEQLNEIKPPATQDVILNGWRNKRGLRSFNSYDDALPVKLKN